MNLMTKAAGLAAFLALAIGMEQAVACSMPTIATFHNQIDSFSYRCVGLDAGNRPSVLR